MIHKIFLLSTLERLMREWPGGSYVVMNIFPIFPGDIPLITIGYLYNSKKVLGFISTEGAVSTVPFDTHLSIYPDKYSNDSVHSVFHTNLIVRYFNACNAIYIHNSM